MSAYGFIYITENLVNGKKYLGQRVYKGRWKYYLGSGKLLKKAIKAYGSSNFSRKIIYEAADLADLNRAEKYFIELYNAVADPNWYNLTEGGKGSVTRGFAGKKHSAETKERMRRSQLGHPVSDRTRNAVSETGKKSSQNPEARRKQAAAISGANHPRARSVTINGVCYCTIAEAVAKTGLRRKDVYKHLTTDPQELK